MRPWKIQSHSLNQIGMTLVEIMIVMAIITSLLGVLLPIVFERKKKADYEQTKLIMGQVMNSLNMYNTDCGKFPSSLEFLSKPDPECSNWGPEAYMKKVPPDGWKHPFQYSAEGSSFVLKSLGADGKEGGDGYNKDISSEDLN